MQCGYESAREDHFLDIPLVIKPFGSTTTHGSVVSGTSGEGGVWEGECERESVRGRVCV